MLLKLGKSGLAKAVRWGCTGGAWGRGESQIIVADFSANNRGDPPHRHRSLARETRKTLKNECLISVCGECEENTYCVLRQLDCVVQLSILTPANTLRPFFVCFACFAGNPQS